MSNETVRQILDECEAHWSMSGSQRPTVLRLRDLLEAELSTYDDEQVAQLALHTSDLSEKWKRRHRSFAWRLLDALGYGAATMALFLWVAHIRTGSSSLSISEPIWALIGLTALLAWLVTDTRWLLLRDREAALMWVAWPMALAIVVALIRPIPSDGSWPFAATALLTVAAGAECTWSLRQGRGRIPETAYGDHEIETAITSILSHGFFVGWPRSSTLTMTSEIRQHLFDARADGKSPQQVMGPDPRSWTHEWAAARGLTAAWLFRFRLVAGLSLGAMAFATFPLFLEGYSEVRIDFAIFVGAAVAVGGVLATGYLTRIWTSSAERRLHQRRTLFAGVLLASAVALVSRSFLEAIGPLSVHSAWSLAITLLAAALLLSTGLSDPFRR
ncbi:MAG TPA: hypothetical protein VMS99_08710 [Acidimicrobiia bacterium]|nr:hypothetical protein [Acidimicrobiia bacterium]